MAHTHTYTHTAISDLTSEMNDQHYHVQAVKSLMLTIKDTFFAHVAGVGTTRIVQVMMQHCMLERVLLSPVDAVYCTQFAVLLNELDVSHHHLIIFLQSLFRCSYLIYEVALSLSLLLILWLYETFSALMT
jgi:Transcription factor/nuclear export subunit protein 2